ncbi:MAG: hypothetical protein MZU79_08920 [Anaerotruncus sp.]|nr:hypothetical protein [Anaerotruncus sp.]
MVPDFNDTPEDIRAIANRVAALGIRELHLLPYHTVSAKTSIVSWDGHIVLPATRKFRTS